ncbi:hypothetical protein GCM10029964_072300 [Kibdelosporangium lantanae]
MIANLGGKDLYGNEPEVAVRELIANASDATKARRTHEGASSAVTIRLWHETDNWWLEVEDYGIGMSPETMVTALTDFGHSRWQAADMQADFPGLLAKGFQPTGRFGIGFFAVFMVADEVAVRSLAYDEAPRSTHVLEFTNGVGSRPLLRQADLHERLRNSGTVVRLKLRHDPRSVEGMFKTTNKSLSHTDLLHSRLINMCALAEVDIRAQGPDDPQPVMIIQADDWTRISYAELFRRVYRRDEASYLDRIIYEGYEKLFAEQAEDLYDDSGRIVGRAMLATGYEAVHPDLRWMRLPRAQIYIGGLKADRFDYCMGAFIGLLLTADRLRSFPSASIEEFQRWLESQGATIQKNLQLPRIDLRFIGDLLRQFDAQGLTLACAISSQGLINHAQLREWATRRDTVLLVSNSSILWRERQAQPPQFYTFDGVDASILDDMLLVSLNPGWEFPEEIRPAPRDERFADAVDSSSDWNPRAWWYDTGNFGSVGLVVRTVADVWGMDVVTAVNTMETLILQAAGDSRPTIPTNDGAGVRVTAIRMRRPAGPTP